MLSSAKARRRVAFSAVLAGVTGLGVTAASAAVSPASSTTGAPACQTSQLRVWRGLPGSGTAGGVYYDLQFSNISSSSCSLFGYPGVSAVNSSGQQLGSAAGRDPFFSPTTVTMAPGTTTHAVLKVTDVSVFPPTTCVPTTAYGLRIYPPNTFTSVILPFPIRACAKAGPVYLSVRTVRPWAGIPGYSQ